MRSLWFLALLLPLCLAVAPAPAGVEARGCLLGEIADPEIAASFASFDRLQSPTAAKACAMFLNNAASVGPGA